MVTSTLVQLLTRFFLVLTIIAVTSSSARPHFGDVNQEVQEDEEYDRIPSRPVLYIDYDIGDNDNRGYLPGNIDNDDVEFEDDNNNIVHPLPDLVEMFKRANTRYPSGMYRRNGIEKKIRTKSTGAMHIRCLVNPVTCFK